MSNTSTKTESENINNSVLSNCNKLDDELNESFLQNSTSNSVSNNETNISIEDNPSFNVSDDIFYSELDKLNCELQIKPHHWTDEYWIKITTKYRWFIHKNEYAGCKICLNVKGFLGRKCFLATMKMYIMNLSYTEFEQKLIAHEINSFHRKATGLLKSRFLNNENQVLDKTNSSLPNNNLRICTENLLNLNCPQCNKGYKFKKSLISHMYNCNVDAKIRALIMPCECKVKPLFSLNMLDRHMDTYHEARFLSLCKFCNKSFQSSISLFEHLALQHDHIWDPHLEPMQLTESQAAKSPNNDENHKPCKRSRSSLSYGQSMIGQKRLFKEVPQLVRQTLSNTTDDGARPRRAEALLKDVINRVDCSQYSIPISSIVTCYICEGRYLSQTVLDKHIAHYHPSLGCD